MTNQILLLFALPVLPGVLLLRILRSDRRRQFVQQRLHAITVGKDAGDPAPQLALHRRIRRAASPNEVFQLYRKTMALLDVAFEATGNRIGLLHLIIAGIIGTIIPMSFAGFVLALNSALVVMLGA